MNLKNDNIEEYESNSDSDFGSDSGSTLDSDAEFDYLLCRMLRT